MSLNFGKTATVASLESIFSSLAPPSGHQAVLASDVVHAPFLLPNPLSFLRCLSVLHSRY